MGRGRHGVGSGDQRRRRESLRAAFAVPSVCIATIVGAGVAWANLAEPSPPAKVLRAALGGTVEDAAPPARPLEFWLDLREVSPTVVVDGIPVKVESPVQERLQVKEVIISLKKQIQAKLAKIGVVAPQGNVVDGILVQEQYIDTVVEDLKEVGIPAYFLTTDFDGLKLPRPGARFVCDAESKLPIGAFPRADVTFAVAMKAPVIEVWKFDWDAEFAAAEERARVNAAQDKRYREGLEDPSKYIMPPIRRQRELFGLRPEPDGSEEPLTQGGVFAKSLPVDPVVWARELMRRRKEKGDGIAYRVRRRPPSMSQAGDV